ncbi:MAG: Ig-like domain-containing protein [Ruminococcus sp.]|nr:Ig-like domain-containing protein [Ruminococcus sp.]
MIIKRIVSAITSIAVLASVATVFSGCSAEEFFNGSSQTAQNVVADAENNVSPTDDGVITNGEWLAMVNDAFGMQVDENAENGEIDSAKEWGVIGEDDVIDLDAPVDDKFVASTLMRASGFADENSTDEEIIQSAIEHGVISSPDAVLSDPNQALASLSTAQSSWSHQTFDEHIDLQLADNVSNFSETINAEDVQISDQDITMPSEYTQGLEKDSIFILPKETADGNGGAYKVIAVIDHADGTATVKSVPASMEEVYQKVDVQGQFSPDYSSFEPASNDVQLTPVGYNPTHDNAKITQLGRMTYNDSIEKLANAPFQSIDFSVELDRGNNKKMKVSASLKDIALNTDVDWSYGLFKGLQINRIYMAVDYSTEVGLEYGIEGEKELVGDGSDSVIDKDESFSKPLIDIGKLSVYICPGISINLKVSLTLEASGKISVKVTTENTKGFEIKGSSFRAINETNHSADIALTGEAGIYIKLKLALSLDYLVGEVDLFSIQLTVGPTLSAEVKIHLDESPEKKNLLCIDTTLYLKIEVKLVLFEKVTKAMKVDASITLVDLDKESSPVKVKGHLENFKRVDHCTAGEVTTTEPPTTATVPVGVFALNQSYVSLDVGSSAQIGIKSLPSGYSASDVVWESADSSKVTVSSDGTITAIAGGSVIVTASTSDGKYKFSCAVYAKESALVNNAVQSDDYYEILSA